MNGLVRSWASRGAEQTNDTRTLAVNPLMALTRTRSHPGWSGAVRDRQRQSAKWASLTGGDDARGPRTRPPVHALRNRNWSGMDRHKLARFTSSSALLRGSGDVERGNTKSFLEVTLSFISRRARIDAKRERDELLLARQGCGSVLSGVRGTQPSNGRNTAADATRRPAVGDA
jgi:hypothetical protein